MRRLLPFAWPLPLLLLAGIGVLRAKNDIVRVTLSVPMPERIDMTGIRRVLVTRFVVDREVSQFDLSKEIVGALRRDLHANTNLEILDVDPPPLPEQPLPQLLVNTGFWRRLADQYGADLVIAGETGFKVSDRSGYTQVDEISPMTGQRVRRSRYVERQSFLLDLRLFFMRGTTGELLYEDHFNGEDTYTGTGNDPLSGAFDLYGQMAGDIRGILTPRLRQVQRSLFTE